ncbi:transporter substrate-binding domain-containing protein [Castellaniella sp. WN]
MLVKLKNYFLVLTALLLVVTSNVMAQDKSLLNTVQERGKVIVGVSSEAPPFGFINEKGELVGFDIDIAKLIARSLFGGKESIEFVKQSFSARWANVQSGKVDFGVQVTTIYPDRLLNVAFTRPYQESGMVVVANGKTGIQSMDDLNNSKYTVALLTAPVEKDAADRNFPKANQLTFDSTAGQFAAVASGRADAMIIDYPVAMYYSKEHANHKIIGWVTDPTQNSVFMKQGDFAWWYYLDMMVGEMRGGSLFHEYAQIYRKWFGEEPINLNPMAKLAGTRK